MKGTPCDVNKREITELHRFDAQARHRPGMDAVSLSHSTRLSWHVM